MSVNSTSSSLVLYNPPNNQPGLMKSEEEKTRFVGTSWSRSSKVEQMQRSFISPSAFRRFACYPIKEGDLSSVRTDVPKLYHNRSLTLNFGDQIFRPSSVAELGANSESLQERAIRWGEKDIDQNSKDMTDCGINGDEIAEAFQSEAAVTIATDKKPIVATWGCGPCIALGGYEPTNKIAFIAHLSTSRQVAMSGGMILHCISELAENKIEKPIQLHLRGGVKNVSEAIVEAIKGWMERCTALPMEIATQDVLSTQMYGGKSLLIDSRNGRVSEYDPFAYDKRRAFGEVNGLAALLSGMGDHCLTLAYSPKLGQLRSTQRVDSNLDKDRKLEELIFEEFGN
jgi:hypothetical protein